jgi:hypothetical protein
MNHRWNVRIWLSLWEDIMGLAAYSSLYPFPSGDSGISPSDARAIYNFVENKARHSVFSYWTFSWTPVTGIDDVLAVLVPPGAMTVDFLSAEGGLGGVIVKVYEEDAHTEVDVGEFLRLSCDVKNASTKDYLNYPVELKVRFPRAVCLRRTA